MGGITELKSKGCVKSVQRGWAKDIMIDSSSWSTIAISHVDPSKAFAFTTLGEEIAYRIADDGDALELNNTTGMSDRRRFTWQVVEFY